MSFDIASVLGTPTADSPSTFAVKPKQQLNYNVIPGQNLGNYASRTNAGDNVSISDVVAFVNAPALLKKFANGIAVEDLQIERLADQYGEGADTPVAVNEVFFTTNLASGNPMSFSAKVNLNGHVTARFLLGRLMPLILGLPTIQAAQDVFAALFPGVPFSQFEAPPLPTAPFYS